MGLRVVRVGKSTVGNMPYIQKCKDWVIELCMMVWLGSLLLGEYLEWEKMPWYMYIVDFLLFEIAVERCKRKLPRRCWRTATYYLLYCAAAFAIAYVIIYFTRPGYFSETQEVVHSLIVVAMFLSFAAVCALFWRRRVVKGREIILHRELIAKRRRKLEY
ncbi:MAG: hypothetical protein IKV33_06250 [Alistipes sp.]|nr:hypothetical protein [Alistipes sp.]